MVIHGDSTKKLRDLHGICPLVIYHSYGIDLDGPFSLLMFVDLSIALVS